MATLSKIAPCLWFDDQAETAAKFYTSVFDDSAITRITQFGEAGFEIHGRPAGTVMTVDFRLAGQSFTALNGGPLFKFSEAVSLMINCTTQPEIDHYWNALGAGGDPSAQQCGWLKDRFGLSWQVVPTILDDLMSGPDRERAGRVMNAMLKMKKLDIAALERA